MIAAMVLVWINTSSRLVDAAVATPFCHQPRPETVSHRAMEPTRCPPLTGALIYLGGDWCAHSASEGEALVEIRGGGGNWRPRSVDPISSS